MQIGMMNNPRVDPLTEIAWAEKNEFDFLDLTLEPSAAFRGQIDLPQVRKALKDSNLEIVGHTAYYLPLASPFERLRKAAVEEMRWARKALATSLESSLDHRLVVRMRWRGTQLA